MFQFPQLCAMQHVRVQRVRTTVHNSNQVKSFQVAPTSSKHHLTRTRYQTGRPPKNQVFIFISQTGFGNMQILIKMCTLLLCCHFVVRCCICIFLTLILHNTSYLIIRLLSIQPLKLYSIVMLIISHSIWICYYFTFSINFSFSKCTKFTSTFFLPRASRSRSL